MFVEMLCIKINRVKITYCNRSKTLQSWSKMYGKLSNVNANIESFKIIEKKKR